MYSKSFFWIVWRRIVRFFGLKRLWSGSTFTILPWHGHRRSCHSGSYEWLELMEAAEMSWTRLDLVVSHCRTTPLGDRRYTMHHHLNHFALFVSFIPPFNIFSVLFDFLLSDKENVKVSLLAARASNRQKKRAGGCPSAGETQGLLPCPKTRSGPLYKSWGISQYLWEWGGWVPVQA